MFEAKEDDRAKGQAGAQLSSILEAVARLEHTRECKDDDCKETGDIWTPTELSEAEKFERAREEYHDEEATVQTINEDPLSIRVRSAWYTPGEFERLPDQFEILLCTGGPAVRIMGELDDYCQPHRAWLEYQDWGTLWAEYIPDQPGWMNRVLTYCQQFYFGE